MNLPGWWPDSLNENSCATTMPLTEIVSEAQKRARKIRNKILDHFADEYLPMSLVCDAGGFRVAKEILPPSYGYGFLKPLTKWDRKTGDYRFEIVVDPLHNSSAQYLHHDRVADFFARKAKERIITAHEIGHSFTYPKTWQKNNPNPRASWGWESRGSSVAEVEYFCDVFAINLLLTQTVNRNARKLATEHLIPLGYAHWYITGLNFDFWVHNHTAMMAEQAEGFPPTTNDTAETEKHERKVQNALDMQHCEF